MFFKKGGLQGLNLIEKIINMKENGLSKIQDFMQGLVHFNIISYVYLFIFVILFVILIKFLFFIFKIIHRKKINRALYRFMYRSQVLSPEEFLELRNKRQGRNYVSSSYNVPGIYILKNETKDMYYVGQGKKVLSRVYNHFSGRGNGDIYADYKYGDEFSIRIVTLSSTRYTNLNDLEREYIRLLKAYDTGYNKTRGNK